jgi:hypothetical protein
VLQGAYLSRSYWGEAVNTAIYLKIKSLTSAVQGKTPYEAWTGEKANLNNLHVFGCTVYVHVPKELRQNLDAKGKKNLFAGYCEESKGYRLLNPQT